MDAPDSTYKSLPNSTAATDLGTADFTGLDQVAVSSAGVSPGTLIADRFRIVRLLGRGGMGEVYEAIDTELSESVAIKTLRSEIAMQESSLLRFRREIQLARKVTHPNVCRLYDVFQHKSGPTVVLCLSMELLRGEPLSEHLRKHGSMKVEEALPIIRQMAAGLTAAHRAGVVHRDFKSANVMLVPDEGGVRAVVTDFGLAYADRDDSLTALTVPGEFLGTPAYIAPEQLEGGPVTPATDVYSFGVVLYEMMTGCWPFRGSSRTETALLRLKASPQSPRRLNPTLSRHWEAAILKCLARKPGERFAFPDEVSQALAGSGWALVAKREFKRYRAALLATLVLAALIWTGLWMSRSLRISQLSAKRPSICVMDPVSMDGNGLDKPTVSQITQLLTNDLETVNSIRVIPRYRVAQSRLDMGAANGSELTPEALHSIRAQMDSDYVVSGAYTSMRDKTGPILRIDLKLYDTRTGEMEAAVSARGPTNEPLELQNELSNQLRSKLGLRMIQKDDAEHLLVSIPPDPAAQKLYSEAVDKLHHYDASGALTLLKRVTEITPKFPVAHLDLAEAYTSLGYDSLARHEATQARSMLSGFSNEKKIYVEARSHELAREWKPAIDLYKELVRTYSDNPEYWLRLALSQGSAGQNEDALQTIATARNSLHTQDPRFALAETEIQNRSGNFKGVFEASRRAVSASAQVNATAIEAKAWVMQCWATLNLGRPAEARSDCAKGAELSQTVHDEATHAKALNVTANALLKEGKTAEAEQLYKQVFQILQQIGDEKNLGGAHLNYGNALLNRSDFDGAEREYGLSLAAAEKRQDKADVALATANIAGVLMARGKLSKAEKLYVDALASARSVKADITTARCLNNLGVIQARRGDLDAAMSSYNDALAMRIKLGSEDGRAVVLTEMGDLLTEEDDFEQAQLRYNEALAIQQRLGEQDDVARTKLSLARSLLLQGGYDAALQQLHEVTPALERLSDTADAALGHSLIAQTLNQLGQRKQAVQEADLATRMVANIDEVGTRMEVQLNCAEVRASDPKLAKQVIEPVETLVAQASKEGLLEPQLRARLILADVRGRRDRESRRVLLESIKAEAQARELKLIARQAQTMMNDPNRSSAHQ